MIDWKQSAELNDCTIDDLKARFERFPRSNKRIVAVCDGCGDERNIGWDDYRDLCVKCAQKSKWDNTELRIAQSIAQSKRLSNPDEREKQRIAMVENHKNNPDVWDEQRKKLSVTMKIVHQKHPESWDTDAVKNGHIAQKLSIIENYKENPDIGERHSAFMQGQDYDAGEWTGYTDKARPHITPIPQCIKLNHWFKGSHAHHITKSIVAFIPAELHNHFKPHNLATGLNMGEINAATVQFIHGGIDI